MSWRSAYAFDAPTGLMGKVFNGTQLYPDGKVIAGANQTLSLDLFSFSNLPVGVYNLYIDFPRVTVNVAVAGTPQEVVEVWINVTDGTTTKRHTISSIVNTISTSYNYYWGFDIPFNVTTPNTTVTLTFYATVKTTTGFNFYSSTCTATKIA